MKRLVRARWLVTGTRHRRPDVSWWLDVVRAFYGPPELLIVGDASGVDAQARSWAEGRRVAQQCFVADWGSYGKHAGPRRNQAMVDFAGHDCLCLAFPAADSRGTWDCVRRAGSAGLPVIVLPPGAREDFFR